MFRFNGGLGAVTCDICKIVLKAPALRREANNPLGKPYAPLDRCEQQDKCEERRSQKVDRYGEPV